MLTRLYVDNFRCFVGFECRFGSSNKQLIIGRNGSGKSSLFEVLLFLQQFAVEGRGTHELSTQPARWLNQSRQTFEIEVFINGASYTYSLVLQRGTAYPFVVAETVRFNQKPLFEFIEGQLYYYDDQFEPMPFYRFDQHRSAFAVTAANSGNTKLTEFKKWLLGLTCFKLNPLAGGVSLADIEQLHPEPNLSNFAEWYLHLERVRPERKPILFESLSAAMDGFQSLKFEGIGRTRLLFAEFIVPGKNNVAFAISELSDGQRCLIYLYTILHFIVANGGTVVIDEPENFLSLRELQPWLMALEDVLDEGRGQVLLISHHPEFINQWAPRYGIQLIRDGAGPVRAEKFADGLEYALPPAELVARGWELE